MTTDMTDVLVSIDDVFPIFCFGEGYIDQRLSKFPFDPGGIERRRNWYARLAQNIQEFVSQRYPELEENECSIVADLRMGPIRKKLVRKESEFRFYESIMAKYVNG